ncbi:hypothetical protein OESDEN_03636 [Oesophagostomum dentatum]|uniref:Uncharacterized protein n=1 Tax=Oesophagostomum dentatum TaxID=61180 RepID=A0A0B1TKP1_OESDE|nr:hypothetical protein OESDEN_03636 [Oesophagostomum dentatum]
MQAAHLAGGYQKVVVQHWTRAMQPSSNFLPMLQLREKCKTLQMYLMRAETTEIACISAECGTKFTTACLTNQP